MMVFMGVLVVLFSFQIRAVSEECLLRRLSVREELWRYYCIILDLIIKYLCVIWGLTASIYLSIGTVLAPYGAL